MASDQSASFDAIWSTVRLWPADERRSLAFQILESLSEGTGGGEVQAQATDLIGAWRSAGPLDDAAVQAVLEDELLRKHG